MAVGTGLKGFRMNSTNISPKVPEAQPGSGSVPQPNPFLEL
jgi:hypothetical protein